MPVNSPAASSNIACPALVPIPEGWFDMGSDSGQDNEKPVHTVWVDDFYLAACQVTNREYRLFLDSTGTAPPLEWNNPNFNDPEQPVVAVSWFDATRYCEWLTASTHRHFYLPTEAQWERAARGGMNGKLFPWGDAAPQSLPDYEARWKEGPERVGQYTANAFGLFDVCENVHEWCSDWFQADYYHGSPERNPRGPDLGTRRSSRGGSWRHHIKVSRCATRSSIPPGFQYADYGFRVACKP